MVSKIENNAIELVSILYKYHISLEIRGIIVTVPWGVDPL